MQNPAAENRIFCRGKSWALVITGTDYMCPYVIIAEDAFPLKPYLMKPYALRYICKDALAHAVYLSSWGMATSVLGHFGPFLKTEMNKVRSDQGPNWLSHSGPEDQTAHQKDRSAHALQQTDIGVRMHVHQQHYSDTG